MLLRDLLRFDSIVIQCHDNPDADAIASGYGLLLYFQAHRKNVRLVYGGRPIQKSNLVLMTRTLEIPIACVERLDPEPELLVTVDCQYGEKNVQQFPAKAIAVIDHHKPRPESLPALCEIRDHYGACASIVWDMLSAEGFDCGENEKLSTALYYGLFMDTSKLQELRHPKDRDMRDALEFKCSKAALFLFQNSNLSLRELEIAGQAFKNYRYCPEYRFAVAEAERCDPNILGVISDMLMEVDVVDACVAFCMLDGGAKLSVRSCTKTVRANELTEYIALGLGSGGGHPQKSGGFLRENLLREVCLAAGFPEEETLSAGVCRLLMSRLEAYFREQEFIYNGTDSVPDLSGQPLYRKKRLPIGYVRAAEVYPENTKVTVRTLEGDMELKIQADTYFIIGAEAEVYINDAQYFWSHNDPVDRPYQFQGEYAPTVHTAVQALGPETAETEQKSLVHYARTCVPKEGPLVYARQLTRRTKVFVPWSDDYLLGLPGDWLVARKENPTDVYIIKQVIFGKTYDLCT